MNQQATTFGAWLRQQRLQMDLTQLELAQRMACSVVTVRKLERDELRPSKQLAERLVQTLHIPTEQQPTLLAFARGREPAARLGHTPAYSELSSTVQTTGLPVRHHNLSAPITPLLGRDRELADLQHLLAQSDVRLVTILGAGGMGKSHLAQELARRQLDRMQEGSFFVALAAVQDIESMATAILDALGYPLQTDRRSPEQQLLDYLQSKQMLLVLDNFEHLLAGAGLINAILRVAPGVKILVTSRERLLLSGEILYRLESLTFPGPATTTNLLAYGAVQLFLQRARHLRPTFEPSADDLVTVGRICQLVEGMPLGILLAAAWVDLLPLPAIADEISQSTDFLESDLRDLPERHRSIRAVFAHSWQRLPEAERTVFMQLALFRGGFTRQAAQRVAGASLPTLHKLVNQSLLQVEPQERYSLHELLRQYAEIELNAVQQREAAGTHHCAYYLGLLAQFTSDVKGPGQAAVLDAIEVDYDNIRAAWRWAVAHNNAPLIAQALESLAFFYEWRGRLQEGEQAFAQAIAAFAHKQDSREQPALPQLLIWQATFTRLLGNRAKATQLLYAALTRMDSADQAQPTAQVEQATILHCLGQSVYEQRDRREAERLFTQSLTLCRACNDRWGEAKVLLSLNQPEPENPQRQQEVAKAAEAAVVACVAIFRELGDQAQLTVALDKLAVILLILGQAEQAQSALAECLAIHHHLGAFNSGFIDAMGHLCIAQEDLGLYPQMSTQAQQALRIAQAVSATERVRWLCALLGSAALAQQKYDEVQYWFQTEVDLIQTHQAQTGPFIQQLVNWGLANYRLGNLAQARQLLVEALRAGQAIHSIRGVVHGLLLGALLLVKQRNLTLAVEIHALALSYPFVANSRWCEEVAGHELTAIAATLPTEIVADARARGQASDLASTIATLLFELVPQSEGNDRAKHA